MSETNEGRKLVLSDGKYTFYEKGNVLHCDRYGEPWRDFVGDKAVHALFDHVRELRQALGKEGLAAILAGTIVGAFKSHSRHPKLEAVCAPLGEASLEISNDVTQELEKHLLQQVADEAVRRTFLPVVWNRLPDEAKKKGRFRVFVSRDRDELDLFDPEEGEERRPSTEEERSECQSLGCGPTNWREDCPLHGDKPRACAREGCFSVATKVLGEDAAEAFDLPAGSRVCVLCYNPPSDDMPF